MAPYRSACLHACAQCCSPPAACQNTTCSQAAANVVAFMEQSDFLRGPWHMWREKDPIADDAMTSLYPIVEFDAAVNLAEYHHVCGNTTAALAWARRAICVWYQHVNVGAVGTGLEVRRLFSSLCCAAELCLALEGRFIILKHGCFGFSACNAGVSMPTAAPATV